MSLSIAVRVAVVYLGGPGHTERHAVAVAMGAERAGAQVLLLDIGRPGAWWADLERADAIVFGCPAAAGAAAVRMPSFQQFMDDSAKLPCAAFRWRGKVAAGVAGADARPATLAHLAAFAARHGMRWVEHDHVHTRPAVSRAAAPTVPGAAAPTPAELRASERLGARIVETARAGMTQRAIAA
ncbi:hypothetical protein [Massilia sp. TN1-12]|uniref:hypothetical protein n=1 Tax=Massilia paldalensis TaxID=3377675 RepID=UPI00384C92AA